MTDGFDTAQGIISAGISITSIYLTNQKNKELEVLKSSLEIKKDEKAAIRDYEYEARKRLYQEFEPLLFLFVEYSRSALIRICNIAMES